MQTTQDPLITLRNISWETYRRLLAEREEGNSRIAYCEGVLEIMTPLGEHERNNRFLDDLIRAIADELDLNLAKFGSTTLRRDDLQKGAEPDSCYYIENEPRVRGKANIDLAVDPPPDLVIEIDITSGSLNKQALYEALGVPELWHYQKQKIQIYILQQGRYVISSRSPTFPWLPIEEILRLMDQRLIDGETATLKAFRRRIRELT
ncbi:MAG TPA: Uma2 family endonuclease [Coleofasciculaceae cyanobacterium]|jgi:Uma2 family endonuclease